MKPPSASVQGLTIKGFSCSPELFETGFPKGKGPCQCASECCEGGVYADIREREAILAHREMIKESMDETQNKDHMFWFEEHEHEDPDFPSGRCVGTSEINDKCVFLDRGGRCSIQVASVKNGMHRWALKPLYCILYPITIEDGRIGFDDMLQDERPCCSVEARFDVPLYEGCKDELVHLLGEDGFHLMQEHYRSRKGEDSA